MKPNHLSDAEIESAGTCNRRSLRRWFLHRRKTFLPMLELDIHSMRMTKEALSQLAFSCIVALYDILTIFQSY